MSRDADPNSRAQQVHTLPREGLGHAQVYHVLVDSRTGPVRPLMFILMRAVV
jgi:hypothetical protein